jgi:hypothetical protein
LYQTTRKEENMQDGKNRNKRQKEPTTGRRETFHDREKGEAKKTEIIRGTKQQQNSTFRRISAKTVSPHFLQPSKRRGTQHSHYPGRQGSPKHLPTQANQPAHQQQIKN